VSSAVSRQSRSPRSRPWPRLADAVGVRRIGTPFDLQEAVSGLKTYGEGSWLIWFLEDYRDDVVLVVRVQHLGVI
jgi:hypothetical protein